MPQLKISDVQTELRESITRLERNFGQIIARLEGDIKQLRNEITSGSEDTQSDNAGGVSERMSLIEHQLAFLRKEMATKNDLVGHVETYNNHIIQQHAPKTRK
jgi:septation ring formation regulator EzrA